MPRCFCDVLCIVSMVTLGVGGLVQILDWPNQRNRAQIWAHPEDADLRVRWQPRQCKVLQAGIAKRGGCWRSSPDEHSWWRWSTLPSDPPYFSECGGVHWCANEGGECDCPGGNVRYGEADQDGTVPARKGIHANNISGSVSCSHGPGLPFALDPAPHQPKYCFCTPATTLRWREIYESNQFGDQFIASLGQLEKDPASEDAVCQAIQKQAFQKEAVATWKKGAKPKLRHYNETVYARRLAMDDREATETGQEGRIHIPSEVLAANKEEKWELPKGHCKSGFNSAFDFLDQDYQVFLPWALVAMDVQDMGRPKLRCASESGSEVASLEEPKKALAMYRRWKAMINKTVDCAERVGGESGSTGCVVALSEDIGKFGSEYIARKELVYALLYICVILLSFCPVLFCCLICLTALCGVTPLPQNPDEHAASLLSESD